MVGAMIMGCYSGDHLPFRCYFDEVIWIQVLCVSCDGWSANTLLLTSHLPKVKVNAAEAFLDVWPASKGDVPETCSASILHVPLPTSKHVHRAIILAVVGIVRIRLQRFEYFHNSLGFVEGGFGVKIAFYAIAGFALLAFESGGLGVGW